MLRNLILAGLLLLGIPTVAYPFAGLQNDVNADVITPTGVAATDFATLNGCVHRTLAACNNSLPIIMGAGNWQICQNVSIPAKTTILAPFSGVFDPGSQASNIANFLTSVSCNNFGSAWTGNDSTIQCFFTVNDYDYLQGIVFYGPFASGTTSPHVGGVCSNNALSVRGDHLGFFWLTGAGWYDFSVGGTAGVSQNIVQFTRITNSVFYSNQGTMWNPAFGSLQNFGADYSCGGDGASGGGFCSDFDFGPGNSLSLPSTAASTHGLISAHGSPTAQIHDIRVEDGGANQVGIDMNGVTGMNISNINCDKLSPCVNVNGSTGISISNIRGGCCLTGSGTPLIQFSGSNSQIKLASIVNIGSGPDYSMTSGSISSSIMPYGTVDAASTLANLLPFFEMPAGGVTFSGTLGSGTTELPTCAAGLNATKQMVSDGASYATGAGSTYTPGGTVLRQVVCNSTNWVYN